jgi:23S rRNA (uracil1939-C5)-methyltransferase
MLDRLASEHGLASPSLVSGAHRGFRGRARLAIRGRLGNPKFGLFELGTHHVVHIPSCQVHHPLINRVASVVRGALVDARVSSYSERARLGLARYLQVAIERRSQTAQVVLVAHCETATPLAECLGLIRERLGSELHSLWFNANLESTNTILGPHFEHVHGPESLVENFGGSDVHYPPGAFGQSNLEIAEQLIDELRNHVPAHANVVEFYAGVGAIGLSLRERAGNLIFNEMSPGSLRGLQLGLAGLDEALRDRTRIVPGAATLAAELAGDADLVIADPPRKGLDGPLLEQFLDKPPERILYVSCDLDSLMRDATRMTNSGAFRLTFLKAFNQLPYTTHVETLACFDRA